MADDRRHGPDDRRTGDYQAARIGAATAFTAILVVLLLAEVFASDYHVDPVVLYGLLGAILTLLGVEALDVIRGRR